MTLVFSLDANNNIVDNGQINDFNKAIITPYTELDKSIIGFELNDNGDIQVALLDIGEVGLTYYVVDNITEFRVVNAADQPNWIALGYVSTSFVYREEDRVEQSFGRECIGRDGSDFPLYGDTETSLRAIPLEQDRYDALINVTDFFGDIIKVFPNQFIANGASGGSVVFDDQGAGQGAATTNDAETMYACIEIPKGKKATAAKIFGNSSDVCKFREASIEDGTVVSKGSAAMGVEANITDVDATQSNYLLISVLINSAEDIVYGGYVRIANI